jgi:hypothetical protein
MARHFFTAVIILCSAIAASAQIVSWQGVINRYAPILGYDACRNEIIVRPGSDVRVGDSVVIFCSRGAVVDTSQTPRDGTPAGAIYAGSIGVMAVKDVQGDRVILTEWLPPYWQALLGESAQIVVIATAKNARIADIVRARPWDGTTGGIVAISVDETLFFDSRIDVAGYGYRGGARSDNGADINLRGSTYPGGSGKAGYRGENVTEMSTSRNTGKNFCMNGGGGGNARNAGGGGGGAFGPGGKGGKQTSEFDTMDIGGRGGFPMRWSQDQMQFGGGGGGGHQNDFRGGNGGNGGGIVIVRAKTIVAGTGSAILANGNRGQDGTGDGAGGGGGGGWVAITAANVTGRLTINASGGDGGDAVNLFACYGPGGGGGGGAILASANLLPNLTTDIRGGRAGVNRVPQGPCQMPFQSYEAKPGNDGDVVDEFRLSKYGVSPFFPVRITSADSIVCINTTSRVTTEGGTVVWREPASIAGRTDTVIDVPMTTDSVMVRVELTTPAGCVVKDSVVVRTHSIRSTVVTGPTQPCTGRPMPFVLADTQWTSIQWKSDRGTVVARDDSSTVDMSWMQGGADTVECTTIDDRGCIYRWTFAVTVIDSLQPQIAGPTRFCEGDSMTLTVLGDHAAVLWSTGATTDSIVVRTSERIGVTVVDTLGCTGSAVPVDVIMDPTPRLTLATSAIELADAQDSLLISTTGSWARYQWSTGDTTSTITVKVPGFYWVDVTSDQGCVGRSDTVEIRYRKIERIVRVSLPDTTGVPGQQLSLPVRVDAVDSLLRPATIFVRLRTDARMLVPTGTVQDFMLTVPSVTRTVGPFDMAGGFSSAQTDAAYTVALADAPTSVMIIDSLWSADTTIIWETPLPATFTLDGYCEEQGGRFFDPLSQPEAIMAYVDVLGRSLDPSMLHSYQAGPIFMVRSNGSVRKLILTSP